MNFSFAPQKLRAAMFAGAALFAMVPAAQAVVVVNNTPIPIPSTIDGVYLNVLTGVAGTSAATAPAGWDINPYNNGAGLTFFTNGATSAYVVAGLNVAALGLGATIGPASTFSGTGQISGSNFQSAGSRYVGFRFINEGTGATHYGYALISSGANAAPNVGFPATILSYAYENVAGTAITIPIPEPSTYALMALGLAAVGGIAAKRRKTA